MNEWTRLLLYGTYDGFSRSTLGDDNIQLILDNGDRVEVPNHFVKNASDFVEKNKIKLKDIIARMEGLNGLTRIEWLDDILYKFGNNYGASKYKSGYEQGKLEGEWVGQQLKDADKIRQELNKPVIPKFVADWIEYCKKHNFTLFGCFDPENDFESLVNETFEGDIRKCIRWCRSASDKVARAWLDGYTVEKEKRYEVILCNGQSLKTVYRQGEDRLDFEKVYGDLERFTRKQLENACLGWVFDCPGVKVKEVE